MRNKQQQERLVSIWNRRHPVGTAIDFTAIKRVAETTTRHNTRSPAWLLGGHTAVVLLEGRTGAVSIEHCTVVETAAVEQVPA